MTDIIGPQAKLRYEHRIIINKEDLAEHSAVLEGEVPMSAEEQNQLKQLLGDGNASVTVSRDLSELSYGNGGKCFASVTIKCDQSAEAIEAAQTWAAYFATKFAETQFLDVREQVKRLAIGS